MPRTSARRRRTRHIVPLLTVLCALIGTMSAGGATASTPTAYVSGVFRTGGVSEWLACAGVGSPTVVFVSGLDQGANYWHLVTSTLGVRHCVYDRPGIELSPAPMLPLARSDAAHDAAELLSVLRLAGEARPVILVGHSYGGLIVRAFRARYPTALAGALLLDSAYPTQWRYDVDPNWPDGPRQIMMAPTEAETAGTTFGSTPLLVMTAGLTCPVATTWCVAWPAQQAAMARLSTRSAWVTVPRSPHIVQLYFPAAVREGVRELVRFINSRVGFEACTSSTWRSVGAACPTR